MVQFWPLQQELDEECLHALLHFQLYSSSKQSQYNELKRVSCFILIVSHPVFSVFSFASLVLSILSLVSSQFP